MSQESLTDAERFLAIVDSTIVGATKEHTAVFTAELNMLKFMYEHNSDPDVRARIIEKAHSLYRNWTFTLNRIQEYRAIASSTDPDSDQRAE